MTRDAQLAQVQTAKAFQVGDYTVLVIAGEKPTPCHQVDIELLPIRIFPPEFRATLTVDQAATCVDMVAPYERAEAFPFSDLAGQQLTIEAADGNVEVTVEKVEVDLSVGTEGPGASIDDIVGPPAVAIGYSDDYDFGAAIKDAIGKLSPRGGGIPDWLAHYRVVEIGADVGGIAGFNRLYVKVSG
jgi:hypothetical protein